MDLSRLIGWLLDPMGDHRLGSIPLERFLALIGIGDIKGVGDCRVSLEVPRYVGRKLAGRIDVELCHPRFEVLIENKPFAGFGDRQLERYAGTLPTDGRQGRVVALLGRGWRSEALRDLELQTGAMALRLGEEVRDWVAACAAAAPAGRVRDLLELFAEDLDERHGGMGTVVTARIVDEALATPSSVEAAMSLIGARDAIAERMSRDFAARVARRLADAGVGTLRFPEDARPLFGGGKNGLLCIDIGLEGFDVALGADGTYFDSAFMSVRARRETPRIGKLHADRVAALTAALGSSSEPELYGWFLWWRWLDEFGSAGQVREDVPSHWGWAADGSDDGLAAVFVAKAGEVRAALGL